MSHKLSIIMPCYNCTSTLEEAVASIYTQNLTTPYEVIMVDDGSTDGTRELIVTLAKKYPNIVYYFHEKNRGGGATRNTGIAKSTGDLIYCLDSDNIFVPNSVQKLIDCLDKQKADGVLFYDRRFFVGNNLKKYQSKINDIIDRPITLNDLFLNESILLDNFLFTKASFIQTNGYPEHHGFDTQAFELRYLSVGFKVVVCPESVFYHRQGAREKSYFERAYESGEFSRNMYLAYEDIFYLFSDNVRDIIINHDIFQQNGLNDKSLSAKLAQAHEENLNGFFIKDSESYLKPNGFESYMVSHKNDSKNTDIFCRAIYESKKHNYEKAITLYEELLKKDVSPVIVYYNILRSSVGISIHGQDPQNIEKIVGQHIAHMQPKKQTINLNVPKTLILAQKIKKIIKKTWTSKP